MVERVGELPEQLRWGIDVPEPTVPRDRPIVLLGMGSSAMAASVGALAARTPIVVHRGYGLPSWAAGSGALVVAVSYSGNTEEVLSGVVEAIAAGLPLAAVTSGGEIAVEAERALFPCLLVPGGLPPRAAIGYQAAAVLRVLGGAGAVSGVSAQIEEAAAVLDELLGEGDGVAYALGGDLAAGLEGRLAVIYGGMGPGSLAAYRWKTQINENAKMPAYSGEVPELNHNELEGWGVLTELANRSMGLVLLRDRFDHPQVARRLELTDEVLAPKVAKVGAVHSLGEGPVARFFSLAVVGDVASILMTDATGVDPMPVELLEDFKVRLRRE
jgi:glucose/mannose-6-phosphate isomerase